MLIIIRGLPGSGKTTKAKRLPPDIVHLETDQFWTDTEGNYNFDASQLERAHDWCWRETKKHLQEGRTVAVSNTFTTLGEMDRYVRLAIDFQCGLVIHNCEFRFESIHPVPGEVLERMKARWDPLDNIRSLPFSIGNELLIPGDIHPYEMLKAHCMQIRKEAPEEYGPPSGADIYVIHSEKVKSPRIMVDVAGIFSLKDCKQIASSLRDAIDQAEKEKEWIDALPLRVERFLSWVNGKGPHRFTAPLLPDGATSRESIYTREDEQLTEKAGEKNDA